MNSGQVAPARSVSQTRLIEVGPMSRRPAQPETMAELVEQIGDVPLDRILMKPAPGNATEKDVLDALEAPDKYTCELVDGVLIEKTMGTRESVLAIFLEGFLLTYLEKHKLGAVLGADRTLCL